MSFLGHTTALLLSIKATRFTSERCGDDQRPLGELINDDDRRAAVREWFNELPDEEGAEHELTDAQVDMLVEEMKGEEAMINASHALAGLALGRRAA